VQYQPDLITDAIARYIQMKQFTDGHWGYGCGGSRAPLCGAEISNTALSMRALQFYAPSTNKAEYEKSIQMAGAWLAKVQAKTNEDRTYKVFGLAWAGKDKGALQKAMKELLATQRADGGSAGDRFRLSAWSSILAVHATRRRLVVHKDPFASGATVFRCGFPARSGPVDLGLRHELGDDGPSARLTGHASCNHAGGF